MANRHRNDVFSRRGAPYGQQWLVEGVATVLDFSGGRVHDERIGFCGDVIRLGGVVRVNAVTQQPVAIGELHARRLTIRHQPLSPGWAVPYPTPRNLRKICDEFAVE